MTLIGKPVVYTIPAIDLNRYVFNSPYQISFKWNGQRCNGNRLTIIETGEYHDITGISSTTHGVYNKMCGIENGQTYHATITMLDFQGEPISNPSDQFLLHCYETPIFRIENLNEDTNVLNFSEFTALLSYYSANMQLSSYMFHLYSQDNVLIDSSPELYIVPDENTEDYTYCSYTFKGLENGKIYYIEAVGSTTYGMELNRRYKLNINQKSSSVHSNFIVTPTKEGNMNLQISCVPLKTSQSDNITYLNNSEINLSERNAFVKYTFLKNVDKDFKLKTRFRGIKQFDKPILSFSDDSGGDKTVISLLPKLNYIYNSIPLTLKDFNWELGDIDLNTGIFTSSSVGTYYVDDSYYVVPDSISVVNCPSDFQCLFYDKDYNYLSCLSEQNINTTLQNSYYMRFLYPKSSTLSSDLAIECVYNDLTQYIRNQEFTYGNSIFLNYIESAYITFVLQSDDEQYTIGNTSIDLLYDNGTDVFYLDEKKYIKAVIMRKNGIYGLKISIEEE